MSKRQARKEQLLECGLSVMRVHGFNGTSVRDIVEAAGVPKGSFYNYFASKEDFAVQALDRVAHQALDDGIRLLGAADDPPLDRLRRFFEAHTDRACAESFTTGCFLGNLGQEMSDSCETIRAKVKQSLTGNANMFREVLRQGVEQGGLNASIDPETTAEFLFNAWEGTLLRMKADKSRRSLDAFLEMLPRMLGAT
jgi:TetR/AcrR family transcriptional repressor of nem operon